MSLSQQFFVRMSNGLLNQIYVTIILHLSPLCFYILVPVALWRHLWYWSGGERTGDRVQPHIPKRHRQEVRDTQVLHRAPDRAAHRGTGEKESHTCAIPVQCVFLFIYFLMQCLQITGPLTLSRCLIQS